MTLAVDYLRICEDVLDVIREKLPGCVEQWEADHDGKSVTPVAYYGINDAATNGKLYPAVLIYPDSSQDESEEQGLSETVVRSGSSCPGRMRTRTSSTSWLMRRR